MDVSRSSHDSALAESSENQMEVTVEETSLCSNQNNEKPNQSTRSPAWNYFNLHNDNKERRAICKICSANFKLTSSTTSPMFNHLSAKHKEQYFKTRTTLFRSLAPILYHKTKEKLMNQLKGDIELGLMSMSQFLEKHTGIYLKTELIQMLTEWDLLDTPTVPIYFVTDNGRNISSAISQSGWNHIYCFCYARCIATHFHHSDPARRELKNAQKKLSDHPPLQLLQMVPTCWNSEYEMLEGMVTLRQPLSDVLSVCTKVKSLTESKNDADKSDNENDIPLYFYDKKFPMPHNFRRNILSALKVRFSDISQDSLHRKSTLLDPRYKDFFLSLDDDEKEKEELVKELKEE
ncbi:hypothetical protein KQX54_013083 [Cotesia glomerata]|uniref:BED-type domain-containing protein n=1 Tax=Cotesia glomerata TaxID=32391 RepID=A0AAV7HD32_COTGL|nr:hypothetical protein KQX54_013083 [Cotesia glomerata]